MAALYAIEWLLGIGLFLLGIFQVLIPILTGAPVFPVFRKKKVAAIEALSKAEEEVQIARIEKTAAELELEAEQIRNPTKEKPDVATDAGPSEPVPH